MKQSDCTGYVIARKNLKDNDKIITVFSLEYGKLSFVAKGVKKPRAKLQGHLEPLVESKFSYLGSGKLPILVGATGQAKNVFFTSSIEQRLLALLLTEVLGLMTIEGQPNSTLYHYYQSALNDLKTAKTASIMASYALLGFMKSSGIEPIIKGELNQPSYYWDMPEGRISAIRGAIASPQVSSGVVKLWSICMRYDKPTVLRLKASGKILAESMSLLLAYLQYHYDRQIKSIKVIGESTDILHGA